MLNITNLDGNANQNYNEIPFHTHQYGSYPKKKKEKWKKSVGKALEKLELLYVIDGKIKWYHHYGK